MTSLRYRPDVDGLRTIAVVPVVLFHAGLPGFSGGFVGVDVFFVISGYLITGILLKDIEQDRFSIAEFYKRRIKRIFPALLLVLAVTTILAWLIFPPVDLTRYGTSLGFVAIFSSNFWFRTAFDYFGANAHVQPLLHTWSLAVEEQFYIFYPPLLYLLSRLRWRVSWMLLAAGVVSFALAVAFLPRSPSSVFYLLPFRAWELIIGGLLACGALPALTREKPIVFTGLIGLLAILLPVALYTPSTPFPGVAALAPCLGAALIIWSGAQGRGPTFTLLASRPFVLIGKASYSFYLWHFPLFAFATYLHAGPFDAVTGVVLSASALALALLTLWLLENPTRRSPAKRAWALPLVLMVGAGAAGFVLSRSEGFPQRLTARARAYVAVGNDDKRHHSECMTNLTIVAPARACRLGVRSAVPDVLLWGDSHSMVAATAMESAAKALGRSFLFAASVDCPPGLGFAISDQTQVDLTTSPQYRYCATYNREMLKRALEDPAIDTVVLAARWTNWRIGEPASPAETAVDIRLQDERGMASSPRDNERIWRAGFLRLLGELREHGKKVFIVGPVPEPLYNVPQRAYVAQFGIVAPPSPIPVARYHARHRRILSFFADLDQANAAQFIWPMKALCSADMCAVEDAEGLLYLDHNHLSVHGAERTAGLYRTIWAD